MKNKRFPFSCVYAYFTSGNWREISTNRSTARAYIALCLWALVPIAQWDVMLAPHKCEQGFRFDYMVVSFHFSLVVNHEEERKKQLESRKNRDWSPPNDKRLVTVAKADNMRLLESSLLNLKIRTAMKNQRRGKCCKRDQLL